MPVCHAGKTAAYILPILERLLYRPRGGRATRVLVLVPTRELAIQVQSLCSYTHMHTLAHIRTYTHSCIRNAAHTHTIHTHTGMHTCIHTHTHTHTHTRTHTQADTRWTLLCCYSWLFCQVHSVSKTLAKFTNIELCLATGECTPTELLPDTAL